MWDGYELFEIFLCVNGSTTTIIPSTTIKMTAIARGALRGLVMVR